MIDVDVYTNTNEYSHLYANHLFYHFGFGRLGSVGDCSCRGDYACQDNSGDIEGDSW